MSKWCGNENCLQCVDKEPDPYVHLPREDYEALRTENARLREALQGMLQLVEADVLVRNTANDHAVGWSTQALLIVQALQQANAALQPVRDNHD